MQYISRLPWNLITDKGTVNEQELDASLYAVETDHKCELQDEENCHPAPFSIGTSSEHEPQFCLFHYFKINNGVGGIYEIVPLHRY